MPERVLVVDDSSDNRRLLHAILRKAGYETLEAADGEEAVALAAEHRPDLILLDIMMPRLDGFGACARLKEDRRTEDLPVIFLSAMGEARDKIRGLEAGGADYIVKPFDRGEVLARVRGQLKIRSLTRAMLEANQELREKQRRLDEDLRAAAGIQRTLLPQALPETSSLEVAWKFIPSEMIGGDMFNVVPLDESRVGIYLLDVSGHGVPAALVTVSVWQALLPQMGYLRSRTAAPPFYEISSPAKVLTLLDRDYPLERFDRYFTMAYMVLDHCRGILCYSNAAHPSPVLLRPGRGLELLEKGGTIIGMGGVIPFEEETIELAAGEKIILYSDGVVEHSQAEGRFYGTDRLYALLEEKKDLPVGEILEAVTRDIERFGDGARLEDDVSLLGFEFLGRNA